MKIIIVLTMQILLVSVLDYPIKKKYNMPAGGKLYSSVVPGKLLFEKHCARCHGVDGTKGKFGAKNLQKSTLTTEEYLSIIRNGEWVMPSWKNKLSSVQISDIINYIKTLRK